MRIGHRRTGGDGPAGAPARKLLTLALLWLLTACAPLPGAEEAGEERARLFLWEIRSGAGTVYLLGSIHLAKPDLYPLDRTIEDAFGRASTLVVEVNLGEVDEAARRRLVAQRGIYPSGATLKDDVREDTYRMFEAFLAEREIPAGPFAMMRPWLASVTLTVLELQRLGYDPELGIDQHFLGRAAEEDKRILELEALEFQIDLFAGLSRELQEEFLVYTIREMRTLPDLIDTITSSWSSGDSGRLERAILDPVKREERFRPIYAALFTDRNARMAEAVRGYLEAGGTYFVVVGAGHVVGDDGILALLTGSGGERYSIRQLRAGGLGPVGTGRPRADEADGRDTLHAGERGARSDLYPPGGRGCIVGAPARSP
ncbi:MAG: TraB/GumN family protein [Acidobacteriota bacterium]